MSKLLDEGNLLFDFSSCCDVERFDDPQTNPDGMKTVDFVAATDDCLYFIEVKDYQNPNATKERREEDYRILCEAGTQRKTMFSLEMGAKIKDSLLRKYSLGEKFTKRVVYLLFINSDKLGEYERGLLKEKISGYVPTGLNDDRFCKFTKISFELANVEQLNSRGIICTPKQPRGDV